MAYNVSEYYRDVVYSGGALYDCHLYIDETLVPIEQISSIKISSPIIDTSDETGKVFHIGTFISQKLDIKFRNLDGLNLTNNPDIRLEIGMMVNGSYEYVPIGKYLIDDLGENYQTTCEITCLDYAVKFKSELDISQFIGQQGYIYASDLFQAICAYYGVTAGSIPNVNNNKQIYTYDSTITGKQYIMYLAELFGGNAKMDRNGVCNIIPLKNFTNIEIDALSSKKFEVGDTYEITRVCYDDGKIKLQSGGNIISVEELPTTDILENSYYYLIPEMKYYRYLNNTWVEGTAMKNTLYLRTDNLFIRQQSEVDAIYNAVNGFRVTNIKCENRMDLSLDCWDIIKYNVGSNYYYTFYDNIINYNGVTMGTVDVKMPLKLTEETTNIIEVNTQAQIRNLRTTVNEQENSIETVIQNVANQDAKISQVTQTVDELNSKIQENMDFTTSGESTLATISIEKVAESFPITIKVRPIAENISYWYPNTGLFPGLNVFLKTRTLRFVRSYEEYDEDIGEMVTKTDYVDYELPDDLLYYNNQIYDEFYYDITNETCQVTKKCKYNSDGTVGLLAEPIITTYDFPQIQLYEGDYEVKILGHETGYIFVRVITDNAYTSQFATKAELSSSITQTKSEIDLSVDGKLTSYSTTEDVNASLSLKLDKDDNDRVVSMLNASADIIRLNSGRLIINSNYFSLDENGHIISTSGDIGGFTIGTNLFSAATRLSYTYTQDDVTRVRNIIMGTITPTTQDYDKYDLNVNGGIDSSDYNRINKIVQGTENGNAHFYLNTQNSKQLLQVVNDYDNSIVASIGKFGAYFTQINTGNLYARATIYAPSLALRDSDDETRVNLFSDGRILLNNQMGVSVITLTGDTGNIECVSLTQTSKEESKKNFEKLQNALDIIKNVDIYKYNMKIEKDKEKKHIGFVIGDDFNYSEEITSKDNDGVDIYSFVSVCCRAIQEQQEEIELLKEEIRLLKEGK